MTSEEPNRRSAPRAAVELDLLLTRGKGSPVRASTLDLGAHGTRVAAARPLGVDELLAFHLPLGSGGDEVHGHARVLREHANKVYALRFEDLTADVQARLSSYVSRSATLLAQQLVERRE